MPRHGQLSTQDESRSATWEGIRGGVNGAARWGLVTGILGIAAYLFSPVYRGLTPQFKVYLQMSGMTVGGMVEAERRVHHFENRQRRLRKLKQDEEAWRVYEEDFQRSLSQQNNGDGKPDDADKT